MYHVDVWETGLFYVVITEILWIWILLSLNYKFLDSKRLQVTHMEALNPFKTKSMTLTARWGLWTFSVILALCVPLHWVHNNVSPGSPCLTVAPFLHSSQAHRTTSWNVNLAYSNIYSLVYLSKIPWQVLGLGVTKIKNIPWYLENRIVGEPCMQRTHDKF